jgi:integrase/recombinase XerD
VPSIVRPTPASPKCVTWEKVSPHTLRHTAGTDLFRETKNLPLVQKALGHSNISTTMIYVHLHDEELEAAMRHRPSRETPQPLT